MRLVSQFLSPKNPSYRKYSQISFTTQSIRNNMVKKLIQIDVSSDTMCPWCCVGKKNLDKAIASSKDQYDFKISWHPFLLDPSAPAEGIDKQEYYRSKFGSQAEQMHSRVTEVFKGIGLEYSTAGLTGNTMDSHRLIYLAGQQDLAKQHELVEELFLGYFTQGKYIGDRQYLLESARKVGVEGAAEFLQGPNNGLNEVNGELQKYSAHVDVVPNFTINGKHRLSGAQPPEVFLRAFQVAATDST